MKLVGYKYRLRPTKRQAAMLRAWMGSCRFLYNAGLEHRSVSYKQWSRSVSYYDQQNVLPEIKKDPEFGWIKEVPSQSLQMALRNLDGAFQNFFHGTASYPQFKKKGRGDSISFPQGNCLKVDNLSRKRATVAFRNSDRSSSFVTVNSPERSRTLPFPILLEMATTLVFS